MGGSRSGRTGGHPTSEGCASIVLTTTSFLRAGLRADLKATASLEVTLDGEPFPVVFNIDTTDPHFPFVEFIHRSRASGAKVQRYRVRLVTTPQRLGGVRWWFKCPRTNRMAVKLYLPLGGHQFWSRQGYQLGYASQRTDRMGRAQLQALKIFRRLEGEGNWREGPPPKPKWMRWRTYERLADKFDAYNAAFDSNWWGQTSRFLSRWGAK